MAQAGTIALVGLTFCGGVVLYLRSPDAMNAGILYAEDGAWMGQILQYGLFESVRTLAKGYLVAGNLLLLDLALVLNWIWAGRDLTNLPTFVAGVGYLFGGFVSALPVVALRRHLSLTARLVLFVALALLPLGTYSSTILGRPFNAGYSFAFLAVVLLAWRSEFLSEPQWSWKAAIIDLALVLCMCTNPFCVAITCVLLAIRFIRRNFTSNDVALLFATTFVGAVLIYLLTVAPPVGPGGQKLQNVVEGLLARPLLYPFVFPAYSKLNIAIAILGSVVLLALVVIGMTIRRDDLIFVAGAALVITAVGVFVTRPALGPFFVDFKSTGLDHYYMAQNMLMILLVVATLDCWKSWATLVVLVPIPLGVHLLFEPEPLRKTRTEGSFAEDLATAWKSSVSDPVVVAIYPRPWTMGVPRRIAEATIERHR